MKILIPPEYKPSNAQKTIISLLEDSDDFQQLTWMVRGKWGIVPSDLDTDEEPIDIAQLAIYETFFERRKYPRLTLAKLRQSLVTSKEFDFHPAYYTKLFERYVEEISKEISGFIKSFRIPRSWTAPITEFILTGEMAITDETQPIYWSQNLDGSITITLAASVSRNAVDEWLDAHWQGIKASTTQGKLPNYRDSKLENLALYKEAYRLRYSTDPNMDFSKVAESLDKQFTRVGGISYAEAKSFVREYELHLNKLIIG